MPGEKTIKKEFKKKAQKAPERYYPVEILKEEGFTRKKCTKCATYFWTTGEREVCGEPDCCGGYSFIGDTPAKEKMDFIKTWETFSSIFEKFGYTPIPRYPTAARWRDDTDFVQASIYDFQPYVVSGEIDPPANPLVVPQFCLRFNDTDNVGITGRHYTGFVMIGQHTFQPPENYRPDNYLRHIYSWLVDGMKIPEDEIQFHEDAWAGGGNMGPSIEFFSRGLEIGNQVYMQYDIKSGTPKELDIKVLDMGMGQERPAWFTLGTNTSYDAVFPTVIKKLCKKTGIYPDEDLLGRFLPYSGILNVDERDDMDRTWKEISEKIGEDTSTLKDHILPLSGIYSIGDHTRSLLVALTDGSLPSNVGGGYNLRAIARRSLDFITRYGWDVSLPEVCRWHAEYLKPQYPELTELIDEVSEILKVEERKYTETKKKSRRIISNLKGNISIEKIIELYDSSGISPEMLKKEGLDVDIPSDFYIRVAAMHEKKEQLAQTTGVKELDLSGIDRTRILYYFDYELDEFQATVQKIIDDKYVILDQTAFYPTSGGQISDRGYINGIRVTDVFRQGNIIIHTVEHTNTVEHTKPGIPTIKEGETVTGKIDKKRRIQLTQHHTATHIINGVSRILLGEHIWQAGAEKTLKKARLDITHYAALSDRELKEIEERANKIISKNLPVKSSIYRRDKAEEKFGFRLYQGGAVPGREIRVIEIKDLDSAKSRGRSNRKCSRLLTLDAEACGGTHLKNTGEAFLIKVIRSSKIQDGIVRLEYTAGEAARQYIRDDILEIASQILSLLSASYPTLKDTLGQYLEEVSLLKKQFSKDNFYTLTKSPTKFHKTLYQVNQVETELKNAAATFSVIPEQLKDTFTRFIKEDMENKKEILRLSRMLGITPRSDIYDISRTFNLKEEKKGIRSKPIQEIAEMMFLAWKKGRKELEKLNQEFAKVQVERLNDFKKIGRYEILVDEIEADMDETLKTAKRLLDENRIIVLFGVNKKISVVGICDKNIKIDMKKIVSRVCRMLGGGGGGKHDFARGAGTKKERLNEAKEWVVVHLSERIEEIGTIDYH